VTRRKAPLDDGPPLFSDEERGDTIGRGWRWLIRLVAVAALGAAALGVAALREDEHAGPVSAPAPTASAAVDQDLQHAAREVRLLSAEDSRLRSISLGEALGVSRIDGTLVLGARTAPYTLESLLSTGAATRVSRSVVVVTEPVAVRRGARLDLHAPGTSLRLTSTPEGYTSLVSWGGSISLSGDAGTPLVVEGWDTDTDQPDVTTEDGRAYVRVKDGSLDVAHVRLRHLGYWSGRTGGLSLTGSSETTAVADVVDATIGDLHIGFYVSGAEKVRMRRSTIVDPQRHGLELTNRSEDVKVDRVTVRSAGEDGVSVSNGTSHVTLKRVTLTGAAGYGLDVDGSPLAQGPNSAGYGIGNYAGLDLLDSKVLGNAAGAVRVHSLDHVVVADSLVRGARSGLVLDGPAKGVEISDSALTGDDGAGLVLTDDIRSATVSGTTVAGTEIGVEVDDSQVELDTNTITVGTGHGVRVSGSDARASLSGNTINGRGSGAVQGRDGATVHQEGATAGKWVYRPAALMWAERHSAVMPFLLVLVVPMVGVVFILRRRRQQRELRRLLEETLVARGRSAISTYVVPRPPEAPPAEPAEPPVATEPETMPAPAAVLTAPEPEPAAPSGHTFDAAALAGREFATTREFAVAAVVEAGYPASLVARVLRVPTSRVKEWAAQATDAP
jgi:hypothetical protein